MRIFLSIILLLLGGGLIAFSYVAAFVTLAGEIERELYGPTPLNALVKIMSYINSGEIPQLMGYLYGGAFIIIIAIMNFLGLFGRKSKNDH